MATNLKIRNKDLSDSGIDAYNVLIPVKVGYNEGEGCNIQDKIIDVNVSGLNPENVKSKNKINIQ